jgi:tripartite-type tricarboxylate transporter receptor subunit TctC
MAINPAITRKLSYDPVRNFDPVARLVEFELGLAVPASIPVSSVSELVEWLKRPGNKAAFGSFGAGTPSQFAGEMFTREAGVNAVHVPYKGSAPLVTDLLGGQVQFGFVVPQVVRGYEQAGKVRLLAITGERRSPRVRQVPTMKELGYEDVVAGGWYGLFVPKGTPASVQARLGVAVSRAMDAPALSGVLASQDLSPAYLGPREFAAFQESEIARWRAVAARTHFTIED